MRRPRRVSPTPPLTGHHGDPVSAQRCFVHEPLGQPFPRGDVLVGCELTCVPTAGLGWPLLPPRPTPRNPHTPGGCTRPWRLPPAPPGHAGATEQTCPRTAVQTARVLCSGPSAGVCLPLSTPSGRARWLCEVAVSHLAPLWHLKGTLLAAEDTGKLQALASWPPSFFPFFFSLLTLADLCVSISPGEAPESIHWAPWDPGTLELGGAVLVVAPRWAEGDMSRASEDSRSRAGGRDSGSLTSRAVSS